LDHARTGQRGDGRIFLGLAGDSLGSQASQSPNRISAPDA
jgi:hypothetical protein